MTGPRARCRLWAAACHSIIPHLYTSVVKPSCLHPKQTDHFKLESSALINACHHLNGLPRSYRNNIDPARLKMRQRFMQMLSACR